MKSINPCKSAILFLFTMACLTGSTQDSVRVDQRELDSLLQLIQVNAANDSTQVKLLNEYAQRSFYNLDFLNGLKAVNEARTLSKQLDFTKGEGLYFNSMAIFHRNHSRLALYYQVQSNRILQQYTHFGPFVTVVIQRGIRGGDLNTIITNLQLALTHFELNNDKGTLAHIHYAIAAAELYGNNKKESTKHYNKALDLFRNLNQSYPVFVILTIKMVNLWIQEKEADAKTLELEAANIFLTEQDKEIKALEALTLGAVYGEFNRAYVALDYLFNAEEILKESGDNDLLRSVYWNISFIYGTMLGNAEKSLEYANKGLDLFNKIGYYNGVEYLYLIIIQNLISLNRIEDINPVFWDRVDGKSNVQYNWFEASFMRAKAGILRIQNKPQQALQLLRESLKVERVRNTRGASNLANDIAQYYRETGDLDLAIEYALVTYNLASETIFLQRQITATALLSQCYEESGKRDKAFEYLKLNQSLNEKSEKLNNAARLSELEIQALLKKSQREIELLEKETQLKQQENKTQRLWIFSIAGALLSAIVIAFILVRNNRQKQKANTVLEATLSNLKSTQSQLIQSEKMASLGELTAGIAHEIQNPLNFVNNFSEVNKELLLEMKEEIEKGNLEELKLIAGNIIDNQEKINHHGRRADAIVKGMLQHSRSSSSVKEATDINGLVDEYLRLTYHGLRAKDKSFNATLNTDYDEMIGNINIIPQDIGRVILNLINNACYAVKEKTQQLDDGVPRQVNYVPTISVSTKKSGNNVSIFVKDNGNGIPQNILDKIFQPFFTTKPTGQGTGLGLSLTYDILKAHGGEIRVETKEGEGAEFIINLPFGYQ